jgi:hypothetical protein
VADSLSASPSPTQEFLALRAKAANRIALTSSWSGATRCPREASGPFSMEAVFGGELGVPRLRLRLGQSGRDLMQVRVAQLEGRGIEPSINPSSLLALAHRGRIWEVRRSARTDAAAPDTPRTEAGRANWPLSRT